MDYFNRGNQNQNTGQSAAPAAAPTATVPKSHNKDDKTKLMKLLTTGMFYAVGLLLVALISVMLLGGKKSSTESKFVDSTKHQAVFLNGGQVYFGKITSLNDKFMSVADIYYLRVNQQVQPTGSQAQQDISLVKLGCELHGPEDAMVISKAQVVFWENLKDDGQVAKAVAEYKKQNPNGQNCTQASQGTPTNSSTTENQ